MDNYIFLDFDGVIVTHRASASIGETGLMTYFDPVACNLITRLVQDFDAQIIISSTWRLKSDYKHMAMLLKAAGFHIIANAIHEKWRTYNIYDEYPLRSGIIRGFEVEKWLNDNATSDDYQYIIIDDERDFHEYQVPLLCLTDGYEGFGFRDYIRARQLFGDDSEKPPKLPLNRIELYS